MNFHDSLSQLSSSKHFISLYGKSSKVEMKYPLYTDEEIHRASIKSIGDKTGMYSSGEFCANNITKVLTIDTLCTCND